MLEASDPHDRTHDGSLGRARESPYHGHPFASRWGMHPSETPQVPIVGIPSLNQRTTIAEVMTTSPHTIGVDQPLSRAHQVMREHHLRHLPVLNGGELVGMLSQRDLYFLEAIGGGERAVEGAAVTEAMASQVYRVAPSDRVADVARTMSQHKHGCAVVVDVGRVVGVFTATDALALLACSMASAMS